MKRVCITGCGHIAKRHVAYLKDRVELAYHSKTQASAQHFLSTYGGIGVYESFVDVCDDPTIDAVVICSPPQAHEQQIVQAVNSGTSVLVEKPMVVSQDELARVQDVVASHPDVFCMVAENYVYKPLCRALLQKLQGASIRSLDLVKMFSQKDNQWKGQYGALFEGGIHFVSLISKLFGYAPPERLQASFDSSAVPERTSTLELFFHQGQRASLRYSWETPDVFHGVFQHSKLCTSERQITFESNGLYVLDRGLSFPGFRDLSGHGAMMQDFLDCLEGRTKEPEYGVTQAAFDLSIVFEAYQQQNVPVYVRS